MNPNTPRLTGMRGFGAVLLGQLVSVVGSGLTRFGLGVWVFERTGSVTEYGLLLFFALVPLSLASFAAGPLVDRWDRRRVLISSDAVAGIGTLVLALLFFADVLQIWHIYLIVGVNSVATAFQVPAFEASVPLLVPKEQLGRAAGMGQLVQAFDIALSPALAGVLVLKLGLGGIILIDFVTFFVGVSMLLLVHIPRPKVTAEVAAGRGTVSEEFIFGLRYIWVRPGFVYLMTFITLIIFSFGFAQALYTPMVLSFAQADLLGVLTSVFGVGALAGGVLLSVWGGPRRRMLGVLGGGMISGLGACLAGLSQEPILIGIGLFLVGSAFTFLISINRAIYQVKAAPDVLGRIFSVRILLGVGAQAAAVLIAGPLATHIFEPLLASGGTLADSRLGALLGVGPGRGMGLMLILTGLFILLFTMVSALTPAVRLLEDKLPDAVQLT